MLSLSYLILLSSYSQGDYVFAQNSPLEEQTTNASNDEINEMQNQEPTETRDGGEYSGFEETGVQTEGIPDEGAESTPQAPISGLEVRDPNDEGAAPFNVTNATGRSYNQTDNTTTANNQTDNTTTANNQTDNTTTANNQTDNTTTANNQTDNTTTANNQTDNTTT